MLEGFTVTNGTGTYNSYLDLDVGGGIYCIDASPVIKADVVTENTAHWGGGVCLFGKNAKPLIVDCSIVKNTASWPENGGSRGGGVLFYKSSGHLKDCLIKENKVEMLGGGVAAHDVCTPVIEGCLFEGNIAQYLGGSFGGGIESTNGAQAVIKNNTFINNRAGAGGAVSINDAEIFNNIIMYNKADTGYGTNGCAYGGGIFASASTVNIHDNVVAYNTALTAGGGMMIDAYQGSIYNNSIHHNSATGSTYPGVPVVGGGVAFSLAYAATKVLTNCMIYANTADDYGGGVYMNYDTLLTMTNCTVVDNTSTKGGGIYCADQAALTVTNAIVFGNSTEIEYENVPPVVTYSDIGHGYPGTGNIQDNPRVVDYTIGDLHLMYSSPCRNAGNNMAPGLPAQDFEGQDRIVDGIVDMGADEFDTLLYYTGDPTPGGFVEIKILAPAYVKPVDLWMGAGLLDPPKHTKYGDWYLAAPWIGPVSLGQMDQNGLKILSGNLPPDPGPYDLNMQVFVHKELTNLCILEVK